MVDNISDALSSKRRLVVLIGMAGTGKRSAIKEACLIRGLQLHPRLIDPSNFNANTIDLSNDLSNQKAVLINHLLFNTIEDADRYVHDLKLKFLTHQNLVTFLALSIGYYQDLMLKHLLDLLRLEGAAIIGVPEWTNEDLKNCFAGNEETQPTSADQDPAASASVAEMLLKIHIAVVGYSKTLATKYTPTPAMLSLAFRVTEARIKSRSNINVTRTAQLQSVIGELNSLENKVETSRQQLEAIEEDLEANQQKKIQMNEDMESTKLTLETTIEQKTSLKRQIPDFQRQVEVRKHDLQASTAKRHAVFEKALEILKEKTPKDIERFCSRASVTPEVEVICSAILVITEGMKYPESGEPMYVWNHFRGVYVQDDWRDQFYSIDPERHGTVTAFFLERRMKELRKLGIKRSITAKEEPIADALLEYCEGFLEIINTVEERIELESRLKVYEEMFVNMNTEVERLQSTEDNLNQQLKTLNDSVVMKEGKMKLLEHEIKDRQGKLSMAEEMANALKHHKEYWTEQLTQLQAEKDSLVERETVAATAAVYLMELSADKRALGLEVIEEAVGCPTGKYANLGQTILNPCHPENILNQQTLPGWQEGIIKKFCTVYDPHNILIDLFTEAEPSLLYIEDLSDLEAIEEAIEEATEGDTLVLNFGSNTNIIIDVIVGLKRMCSNRVSIFLCISQWTPLPSRVTFVNLDMSGQELRKMAVHLISLKDQDESKAKGSKSSSRATREFNTIEAKLMNMIMTPKPLSQKHRHILDLSSRMDKAKSPLKDSLSKSLSDEPSSGSTGLISQEMLFPTAIIAACCDMSTVGLRPFMSLSQFVNFTLTVRNDESEDTENMHRIIFQRYCLSYADKEQLLFQTFILLHYNILKDGVWTEGDRHDFLNVVAGHEKKEFPLSCPDWADPAHWHHLKKIVSEKNYHLATHSLEETSESWRHWYENAMTKGRGLVTESTNGLVVLLIKCALRQMLIPVHLSQFVSENLLPAMVVPANLCLDYVHSFSTSTSPILLYIDPKAVEDPTFHLKKLADVQGIASTKVSFQ